VRREPCTWIEPTISTDASLTALVRTQRYMLPSPRCLSLGCSLLHPCSSRPGSSEMCLVTRRPSTAKPLSCLPRAR
jgi:hypothetical protein